MMGFVNGSGFMGMGMFFWMILQWGLLILGIFLLIRWVRSDKQKPDDTALQILRERFARGEITDEEFNERKNKLMG